METLLSPPHPKTSLFRSALSSTLLCKANHLSPSLRPLLPRLHRQNQIPKSRLTHQGTPISRLASSPKKLHALSFASASRTLFRDRTQQADFSFRFRSRECVGPRR